MDMMQILTTELEAFTISALAMVGSLVAVALIAIWDQHAVKGTGVHVKSSKRDLLLASELAPCKPVSDKIMAVDPINAMYDTENSYPEYCPPVSGKKGTESAKKAA
jgi:hypothetical protein